MSNALKYTKAGGSISIEETEPGVLCAGIRELVLRRRICPGFLKRGIQAVTEGCEKKASGIGLYLCKRICERLGT